MNVRNFEKIDYEVQKIFCQNDDADTFLEYNNDLPPTLIELQVSQLF